MHWITQQKICQDKGDFEQVSNVRPLLSVAVTPVKELRVLCKVTAFGTSSQTVRDLAADRPYVTVCMHRGAVGTTTLAPLTCSNCVPCLILLPCIILLP